MNHECCSNTYRGTIFFCMETHFYLKSVITQFRFNTSLQLTFECR